MAKFHQRKNGGYYTVVKRYDQISTLQIHPEGGNYLLEHDVWPEMEIPYASWKHLSDQGWLSTKGLQGPGELGAAYEDEDTEELDDAENLFESPLDDLPSDSGHDQAPEPEIIDVVSNDPVQAHANRPVFLFDGPTRIHYTVLHLNGGNGLTEPTVMCIKYRAAQWLKDRGAKVGRELPEGAFETLFLNRWFYPNPGWKPDESRPLPLHQDLPASEQPAQSSDTTSRLALALALVAVLAILIYVFFSVW